MVKQTQTQTQKKQNKQQEQVPVKDRTVFLSGLPYECNVDEVQNFFSNLGKIEEVKLPRYQDTGKCRGYAHVTFENIDDAQEALKMNKQQLGKRYVDISMAKGEKTVEQVDKKLIPEECQTIFVKNLPYNVTEDEVGDFFRENCGDIENIRFSYHSQQSHFKGFGYIDFKFNSSVRKAMDFNGQLFKGRPLFIDFEVGNAKAGYKIKIENEGNQKIQQISQRSNKQKHQKRKIGLEKDQ